MCKGCETMRIAICDDEKSVRQMLNKKIEKMYPNMNIEQFASGRDLLFGGYNPDILLLDIQMPGENGMEIAKKFRIKNERSIRRIKYDCSSSSSNRRNRRSIYYINLAIN